MKGRTIIKAGSNAGAGLALAMPAHQLQPDPRDEQIALLRREIAELKERLKSDEQSAAKAVAKAREEGLTEGRRLEEKDDAARTALVLAATEKAAQSWRDRLESLESLAVALACEAVEQILGDSSDECDILARALGRQLTLLGREAVLAVHVSASDFDEAAVPLLESRSGATGINIVRNPGLRSGECRIDLKLGHLDIGPRSQWQAMRRHLETIAGDGPSL
jgi:type III secretion protein L